MILSDIINHHLRVSLALLGRLRLSWMPVRLYGLRHFLQRGVDDQEEASLRQPLTSYTLREAATLRDGLRPTRLPRLRRILPQRSGLP